MRRARGYTLLELGIVLAVSIIFMTAVAAASSGFFRAARALRTGDELNALARAAAHALSRNLVPQGGLNFQFRFDGAGLLPITNTAPLCYDLSRFPTSTGVCAATGAVGTSWASGVYANVANVSAVPAGSPLLAMAGGNRVYSNGFNAWCEPYVACLYPNRAEVLTCVPQADVDSAGLAGAATCGTCGADAVAPVGGGPTVCVMVSVPTLGRDITQLRFSYSPGTFPALPPVFNDSSPRL